MQILQADFLRSDGQQEVLISSLRYRLHMTTDNAAIAYFDQWEEFAGNSCATYPGNNR